MSGNNPNILYSLNVLGNATVQGILDCTEVAIDNVVTENVETDSLTVNNLAFITQGLTTANVVTENIDTQTANIDGVSTGTDSVLSVNSASTSATTIGKFLAPSSGTTNLVLGQALTGSNHTFISATTNSMKFGIGGNAEALTLDNLGNATIRTNLTVSGLTASLPVSTNGSKQLVSASVTGTGSTVLQTSPSLITPALGIASATSLASESVSINGVSTTATTVFPVTSASTSATTIASFLAPAASSTNLIFGQSTGGSFHSYISSSTNTMKFGIGGNAEAITLTNLGDVTIRGKLIVQTPSCYTYLSSSTTVITAGIPTNMLHWGVNGAAANSGDALTYDNGTGRFSNNLGRTVLAIITITARTDLQVGRLTATLQSSSLSGAASVSNVTLGDFVALSASIVMGPTAHFSLQGIATVGAAWQNTGACITVSLF